MLTFAYYLLKVIICSGILYGYYLLALRNKVFHRWNRFYLLAAVVLSLAAPLIKINIWQNSQASQTQVIHLIQVVSTGDEFVYEYTRNNHNIHINATNLSIFIYTIISGLLIAFLIQTLVRIKRLKHRYPQTIVEGINFINTDARGTPFSFFNNIFWNTKIDLNTSAGEQIFQHEVAHVQEKHSYDKILMNIVLIFFWCNPIFWLIRKELNMIHEFIADKKAVEDSDAASFAAMILQTTYPQHQFNITNNFFYSPLKRRLIMLTKNKQQKINYISRLLVLPLAALLFFAFTLKMKTIESANYNTQHSLGQNSIQDTAENITSTDQIKKFIQDRISEMKENSPQKEFLMNKLSELKGNSFKKEVNIDSIPQYYNGKKIKEAQGSEKLNKALISYEDGSKGTISIAEAEKIKLIPPPPPRIIRKETNIEITSENKADSIPDKNDKIYIKVETEAHFPGGDMAWGRYIKKIIENNIQALLDDNKSGTIQLRFIVDMDGSVRDITALSMQGTKLSEVAIEAVRKGPKWVPADQNGHIVSSYKEMPITFTFKED